MSNSNFDINGAIQNLSKSCEYSDLSTPKGEFSYNFACILSNATNTNDAFCYIYDPEKMDANQFDCNYFFGGSWRNASQFPNYTCAGNCDSPAETKTVGVGVSVYPSFSLSFVAVVLTFIMIFKRGY
jgi:hypothetical protein